jgi:glycosyltransferase involved in cell wall biosynthesis
VNRVGGAQPEIDTGNSASMAPHRQVTVAGGPQVQSRRVLMICYLFPPAGGSAIPAVQRVTKFIRGMVGSAWHPVVLTLEPDAYEGYITREDGFLRDLPAGTTVERTGRVMIFKTALRLAQWLRAKLRASRRAASSDVVARPAPLPASDASKRDVLAELKSALDFAVQTPDPHIGWLPHAYFRGRRIISQSRIDCIYATGSPWSAVLVGALLKRATGIPLMVDFRDPWVTNPYRAHFPVWRKRIERRLEAFSVRNADIVVANTRGLRDEFRERYPGPGAPRFDAIYNSVERSVIATPAPRRTGRVRLSHAGFLYGPRDPLTFLRAVATRRRKRQAAAAGDDLAIELIGAVEMQYSIYDLLETLGIADVVTVHGPVPHARCEAMLGEADALLLLQPGTKTQLPSKLFEYVTFGKPILTLGEPGGETCLFAAEVLQTHVADCNDEAAIVRALDRLVADVQNGNAIDVSAWEEALSRYSAAAINEQLLASLDSLARR